MTCRLEVFYFEDPMTRQRISASTWHEHVAHWRSSGLPVQAYAHEHNIGVERLRYWVRRIER
ncbi:IS66 family insertion sequence element accessory protein TnpA, partial [Massilia timonae]|uniref:IS66 family insertion sequence element accessory protein TnpA n=1 Tax=Massilia timonae TaxID=47229 RepID=UPI003FCC28CF